MKRGSDAMRVLLVEDDDAQADLTASFLEREDDAFSVTTRSAAEPALDYLQDAEVDCVLSDHDMPGKDGLELLDDVRDLDADLPFVLFTGKGSEEIASEAISAGVTDYLQKEGGNDQYAVLANRVRNAVEKRRSQRALREEKHRLEQVLATTPGSVVFTPDGGVVSATDRARATLGLDGDDAPDRELATIDNGVDEDPEWELTTIDGDPIPDGEHPAARVARSGQPLHGVRLGVVWPDGWRKYLVMHCAPLFDDDGTVERVVASFTDITDRVERERTLERTQTVIDAIGDAVYTADEDGEFTFANDAFEEMFDVAREEILGEYATVALADDHVNAVEDTIRELLDGDRDTSTVQMELADDDGDPKHIETHVALLPFDDGFRGTAGVVRDVTERVERERKLRESEEKYATVVEEASDAVLIAQDDVLKFANPRAADILDTTPEDVVGTPVTDVVAPEHRDTVAERLQRRLSGESPKNRYEFEAVTVNGERVPIEFTAATIRYEGEPAVLAICRDVTERKQRERELESQNERLAEFTNVVSHDLRSPLNVATGWLERYRETGDEDALDRVERSHDRMTEILDELLSLARNGPDVHDTDEVLLEGVCASAWASVTTGDAHLGLATSDATVEAAESRLQELFENLFSNAIAHVGEDVTVRVGLLEDREGFFVEDDGSGIPEDERDEVFEMGHTTSEDGTGFGLAIVEQVADAHDWTVRLTESENDEETDTDWTGGARFEFVTASEREEETATATTSE
jgi:PAS domain S-box-containing protein